MPKYVFAYHGGSMPESEEEAAKVNANYNSQTENRCRDFWTGEVS